MRWLPFLLILARLGLAEDEEPSCVTHCHGKEATEYKECVHEGELTCMDCHGGDPKAHRDKKAAHDPKAGFRGRVPRDKIPELCAKCHSDPLRMHAYDLPTDQLAHFRTSDHGKALARGDTDAAVCTDCHSTHRILPAHDPRAPTASINQPATCGKCHADRRLMQKHGLPADSVERFERSVHGRKLLEDEARGAPSCADCHGAHGASPPGVGELVQVCAKCHIHTAEHYREGPHAGAEMECRACHEKKPARRAGCAACHDGHEIVPPDDTMYEGDEVGQCGHCHRKDKAVDDVIAAFLNGRRELQKAMAETRREIRVAKARGVFLDNEPVYLRESERTLVSVQPLAHSLDAARIREHLNDGVKRQDRTRELIGKKAKVLRDRRLVLGGLAFILLLLAMLLYFKLLAVRRLS